MSEDVLQRVISITADTLSIAPEEVKPDARFREDLQADSLDLVELIMAFEDEFFEGGTGEQRISDEDARQITTVGEAAAYLEGRLQENA